MACCSSSSVPITVSGFAFYMKEMINLPSRLNGKLIFCCTFVAVCIVLMIYSNGIIRKQDVIMDVSVVDKDVYNDIQKEAQEYMACIMKQFSEAKNTTDKLWVTVEQAVTFCVADTRFKDLPLTSYDNKDERKYYVHDENMKKQKSVVLTLGVGKDVMVEQKLKDLFTNDSEFFAADPMPENAPIFAPVGIFIPFAVGKTTGITNATVLTEVNNYQIRAMMHIDIMTFMTQIVRHTEIDMFLMDNEGPEYDIQPMMGKGREFDKAGITVCQINTEFHVDHMTQFNTVIMELFSDNRFIPLYAVVPLHVRMFMVNIDAPYCVNRYISKYFTTKKPKI